MPVDAQLQITGGITKSLLARLIRPMDTAPAGRQARGTGDCRRHFARNGTPDTENNELKPWLKERYCLPEEPSGEFVYHMEDVLDVYTRPYDPRRPQVCLDETSVQLIAEKRIPVAMAQGRPARFDYEYERNGVCTLFMVKNRCAAGARWSSATSGQPLILRT